MLCIFEKESLEEPMLSCFQFQRINVLEHG